MKIFDTQKIGQKIAATRKEKNLTQLELADALGVSYQAVSNWERGQSMPDIEKLPELASFLQLSLDDLLGNTAAAEVHSVTHDENIEATTIAEVAPLIKPRDLAAKVQGKKFSLAQLVEIAPYLSAETLHTFVNKREFSTGDLDDLEELAPYLASSDLLQLLQQFSAKIEEEDYEDLAELAVYLENEQMNTLFVQLSQHITDLGNLEDFFPHVADEILWQAAESCLAKDPTEVEFLEDLAPYLNEKQLGTLFQHFSATVDLDDAADLAPYVAEKDLLAFLTAHRKAHPDDALSTYEDFFPYLSEKSLLALLTEE
ncbi:helix-turn-helix domain-containing protein [Enterococcus nangangensis]